MYNAIPVGVRQSDTCRLMKPPTRHVDGVSTGAKGRETDQPGVPDRTARSPHPSYFDEIHMWSYFPCSDIFYIVSFSIGVAHPEELPTITEKPKNPSHQNPDPTRRIRPNNANKYVNQCRRVSKSNS